MGDLGGNLVLASSPSRKIIVAMKRAVFLLVVFCSSALATVPDTSQGGTYTGDGLSIHFAALALNGSVIGQNTTSALFHPAGLPAYNYYRAELWDNNGVSRIYIYGCLGPASTGLPIYNAYLTTENFVPDGSPTPTPTPTPSPTPEPATTGTSLTRSLQEIHDEIMTENFPVNVDSTALPVGMSAKIFLTYGDGFREEKDDLGDFFLNPDHVTSGVTGYIVYYDTDANGVGQQVLTEQLVAVPPSNIADGSADGFSDTITGTAVLPSGYSAVVRVTTGDGAVTDYPVTSGTPFSYQLTSAQIRAGWSAALVTSHTDDGVTTPFRTDQIGNAKPMARDAIDMSLPGVEKTGAADYPYKLNGQARSVSPSLPGLTASLPVQAEINYPEPVTPSTVNSSSGNVTGASPVELPVTGSGTNGTLTPQDIKVSIESAIGNGRPTVNIEPVAPVPEPVSASATLMIGRVNTASLRIITLQQKAILLFEKLQNITEKFIPRVTFSPGSVSSFDFAGVVVVVPDTPGWLYALMQAFITLLGCSGCYFGVTKIWSY